MYFCRHNICKMQHTDTPIKNPSTERPSGLSFLCILSFIGSGLSLFSHLVVWLFYNSFEQILSSDVYANIPNLQIEELQQYLSMSGRGFFLVSAALFALSLWGVYKMWKMQKIGIHYYAIAQILLVIAPLVFISRSMPVVGALLFALLFILLYARYHKMMH